MRQPTAVAMAALLATVTACSASMGSTTTGSGKTKTESRAVSGVSAVNLQGVGDLTIEQTGKESLTITADDNVLSLLTSKVSDGTLLLGTKSGANIVPKTPIHYRLTVKSLVGVELSGSGNIVARGIDTTTLNARLSGSGTITVGGTAVDQRVNLSGSGRYLADALVSTNVTADVSGSGDVGIRASRDLHITISGSGTVTYSGHPHVIQQISGSGTVIRR